MSEKIRNPRNCSELGPALRKITKIILSNQNICKLLYYTDIDLNDKHICNYKCFRNKEKLLEELKKEIHRCN